MRLNAKDINDKSFLKDEFKDISFKNNESNLFELYYELSTYYSPMDFEYKIQIPVREYYENIDQLSMHEVELIKQDDTNILAGYFLTSFFEMSDELLIKILDDDQDSFKIAFGCAYIIFNEKLNIIKPVNKIALKNLIYLTNIQKLAKYYSDFDFTNILKKSETYNHPMYTNNLIRNTVQLIVNNIINSESVRDDIVSFFSNKEYYHESDIELILTLSRMDKQFINMLIDIDFKIDNFTEQTNFGYWLKEFQKYKMFEKLILTLKNSELSKKFVEKYRSHSSLLEWHKKIGT